MVQLLEKSLSILRKLSLGLPYDLAIPFTGTYSVEQKIHVQTNTHMQMFTAALFIIARMGKQPNSSLSEEGISEMWHIHTMGIPSIPKKEGSTDSCWNMDEP